MLRLAHLPRLVEFKLDALLCLWEQGHFKALCKKLNQDKRESAPCSCLFDTNSPYFLPVHQAFRMSSEGNKYLDGMKIVALWILDQDWKKIIEGEMTEESIATCLLSLTTMRS